MIVTAHLLNCSVYATTVTPCWSNYLQLNQGMENSDQYLKNTVRKDEKIQIQRDIKEREKENVEEVVEGETRREEAKLGPRKGKEMN